MTKLSTVCCLLRLWFYIADCGEKVRSYSTGDCFGEIALVTEDNKRTATVRVASDTALVLRLARADVDDDLLDALSSKATLSLGDLQFAGDMETQLEESKEECASMYTHVSLPQAPHHDASDNTVVPCTHCGVRWFGSLVLSCHFAQCCVSASPCCWRVRLVLLLSKMTMATRQKRMRWWKLIDGRT